MLNGSLSYSSVYQSNDYPLFASRTINFNSLLSPGYYTVVTSFSSSSVQYSKRRFFFFSVGRSSTDKRVEFVLLVRPIIASGLSKAGGDAKGVGGLTSSTGSVCSSGGARGLSEASARQDGLEFENDAFH